MTLTLPSLQRRHLSALAIATALAGASILGTSTARADAVTEWNERAGEIIGTSGLLTQPANRVMAIAHTAAFEAANAITRRYPTAAHLDAPRGASVEAAIAAAHRTALSRFLPAQQAAIDAAYQKALAQIANGTAKDAGIALGERAAQDVIARRADDGAAAPESYRPLAPPGRWVPTALPAAPQWPQRKPWVMTSASQFRPGPPPALTSERWARDYNEIKAFGGAGSGTQRSAEQGTIARFWETTLPAVYYGAVRSVVDQPGRDLMRNARLFAALTQAIDDALIAVFDAKYHYALWRPVTAIRNGDQDGNDATDRDPSWTPFLATPMHPEYPCAHCIQAGVIGAFLQHEIGPGGQAVIVTRSNSSSSGERRWTSVDALVQEVANARIYGGMHYRYSTEVGADMGRRIGTQAIQRLMAD